MQLFWNQNQNRHSPNRKLFSPRDCGEDGAHGVGEVSALCVGVGVVLDDLRAVLEEAAAEEHVREVQVDHVHQEVEHLAQEKLEAKKHVSVS